MRMTMLWIILFTVLFLPACQSQTDMVRESLDKAHKAEEKVNKRNAKQANQAKKVLEDSFEESE